MKYASDNPITNLLLAGCLVLTVLLAAEWLMPYEILVNPEPVESRSLHWPWKKVKAELDKLESLGQEYRSPAQRMVKRV